MSNVQEALLKVEVQESERGAIVIRSLAHPGEMVLHVLDGRGVGQEATTGKFVVIIGRLDLLAHFVHAVAPGGHIALDIRAHIRQEIAQCCIMDKCMWF